MGADFICVIVGIREEVVPDYRDPDRDEIDAYLHNLGLDPNAEGDRTEALENLRKAIATVREALEKGSRECEVRRIGGRQYVISGGMSWGEEPTELCRAIGDLDEAGILGRLGLEGPGEEPEAPVSLNQRELATVLAGLRCFQTVGRDSGGAVAEHLRAHFSEVTPLDHDEIDALCERLNCGSQEPEPEGGAGPEV